MAYPRFQRSRDFKRARRTAGNVTIGTSIQNVDTALDLALVAEAGDYIEYGISAQVQAINGSDASFDVATIVSAAVVNYISGLTLAVGVCVPHWYVGSVPGTSAQQTLGLGGSMLYPVVAGDLSAGTITLRLRAIGGGSGAAVLRANASNPLTVWAKNLGPADPN